jgi:EAL domain-containing protein (putative c-di-GMP-specific phosphodiesterase class I)
VQAKVQRLIEQVSRPHAVDGHEVLLQCRAGMARFPEDGENAADLIRRASMAMFATTGEECCGLFSQVMEDEANQWSTLEAALRYALERDQIDLHYQPKISLVDGRVMGMEALMRWHHPQLGMVPPVRFIPVAEETGLISSLGAWEIRRAIRDTQSWHAAGFTDLVVAVNLSARQLRNATLPAMLERQLRETNWDPAFLELEITESTAMENVNEAVVALEKLRQLGVGLAIDDFGTGYSSLAYLKRLPITTLKVDRSFVMDICDNPDDAAIAATIVAMSRTLGMKTVAEGVERLEHETFLRSVGCDYGQGYLYSRPLPAGDFTRYLEEHRR